MEIAKLILEFVKALAWPMVVLSGFVIFHGELRKLVGSLQKLKLPGGAELDWQKQVQAAEEAAEKVEASPKLSQISLKQDEVNEFNKRISSFDLLASPSNCDFSYYRTLAGTDPNLALAGLRMELERMLQNMAKISGIDFDKYRTSPGRFSIKLKAQGILNEDEYGLIRSVVNVANAALHGRDVPVRDSLRTIESSEAFLDSYIAFMSGAMDRIEIETANN